MVDAGIHSGDVLVVDCSFDPGNNSGVIAVINGEMTVKQIIKSGGKLFLVPANLRYHPIEIREDTDFAVWGVVTSVIHTI